MTENRKIVVELINLGDGHIRKAKRELKVIIEDYGWKAAISECIRVTEEK